MSAKDFLFFTNETYHLDPRSNTEQNHWDFHPFYTLSARGRKFLMKLAFGGNSVESSYNSPDESG